MSDDVTFWAVAAVSLVGCIVGPFVVAVAAGPWFGLLAGALGYGALIGLVLIERRRG